MAHVRVWRLLNIGCVLAVAAVAATAGCDSAQPEAPKVGANAAWRARVEKVFGTTCHYRLGAQGWPVDCDNGCSYAWEEAVAQTPAGIFVYCPSKPGAMWEAPCKSDAPRPLTDPLGHGHCWGPPSHFCFGMVGMIMTVACDPQAKACCGFTNDCVPCGWEVCADLVAFDGSGRHIPSSPMCATAEAEHWRCPDSVPDDVSRCDVCSGISVCPPNHFHPAP